MVRRLFFYSAFRCETFAQPMGSAIPHSGPCLFRADGWPASSNVVCRGESNSLVCKNDAAALISALVNGSWRDVWHLAGCHHRERTPALPYPAISGFFRVRRIRKPRPFFPREVAPQICVDVLFHISGKGRHSTHQLFLIDLQHDFSKHWKCGSAAGFPRTQRAIVVESDTHRHCVSIGSVRRTSEEGIPVVVRA